MQTKTQVIKKDMSIGILGIVAMSFFVFLTNPKTLPVPFLLILPVLVAVVGFVTTRAFINLFSDMTERRVKLLSSSVSVGLIIIFSLGTVSQLGLQDIVLALSLMGGLGFYLSRFNQSY